jgi:hypothetical protein
MEKRSNSKYTWGISDTSEQLLSHINTKYKNEIVVNAKSDSLLGLFYILDEYKNEKSIPVKAKNILCEAKTYAYENFNQILPTYVLNPETEIFEKVLCELHLPETKCMYKKQI